MAYVRTTRDEWQLWVKYDTAHGYEYEVNEPTYKLICQRAREYRENCPQYPLKIKKARIKVAASVAAQAEEAK